MKIISIIIIKKLKSEESLIILWTNFKFFILMYFV